MDTLCRTGKVLALKGELAVVRFAFRQHCGSLQHCLSGAPTEPDLEIQIPWALGGGDVVAIELRGKSMVRASLLLYVGILLGLLS